MPDQPLILFYNDFYDRPAPIEMAPADIQCRFSRDRADLPEAAAVVFHLPSLKKGFTVEKWPGQLWVAWSMEAAGATRIARNESFMAKFDLHMAHRQDSDIWIPYFHLGDDIPLLRSPPPKIESAPVVRFQSNLFDKSGRNELAARLMTHVKIDSYGSVDHNRDYDGPDLGARTMREVLARYKFALAFENVVERDYVSEKFYDPLLAGTVPVYLGAPNVDELAPGDRCYIDVRDFDGPDALADYLNMLDQDDDAYRAYFAWKEAGLRRRFRDALDRLAEPELSRLCRAVRRRLGWPG